jgi:hypothetical protein
MPRNTFFDERWCPCGENMCRELDNNDDDHIRQRVHQHSLDTGIDVGDYLIFQCRPEYHVKWKQSPSVFERRIMDASVGSDKIILHFDPTQGETKERVNVNDYLVAHAILHHLDLTLDDCRDLPDQDQELAAFLTIRRDPKWKWLTLTRNLVDEYHHWK